MSEGVKVTVGSSGGTHTYSHAEKRGYCDFINQELADEADLAGLLPMDPTSDQLFTVISKGVLLCKLINKTFENAVSEAKLNKKPKNTYQVNENHDLCIEAAKKIGCSVVNIGGKDLEAGIPHLTMGLLWQIIKRSLMYKIENMDLARMLAANESLANVPPEQILLRWFNCHLKNAGHNRTVANFSSDLQDAENYAVLLSSIAPDKISSADLEKAFAEKDTLKRAEIVLEWADRLQCRKFVTAQDIIDGNPNLNLAFVACLFQKYPDIGPSKDDVKKELEVRLEEVEGILAESLMEKEGLEARLNRTRLDYDNLSSEFNGLKLKLDDTRNERDQLKQSKTSLEELLNGARQTKEALHDKINAARLEKDNAHAKLMAEKKLTDELQQLLNRTKADLADYKAQAAQKVVDLSAQIDKEIAERTEIADRLEKAVDELERAKQEAAKRQADLKEQIQDERRQQEELKNKIAQARSDLEDARKRVKEAEQTKDDLFRLLTDTIAELETTKADALALEEELRRQISAEISQREEFDRLFAEKSKELELALADWAEERARLLKRIKELEDELAATKVEMRMKLDAAEKEMEDALAEYDAELKRLLMEAEDEKERALSKVCLLLDGNQKQGVLYKYEESLIGTPWKKKYFVLRDNLLSWYNSEKRVPNQKPKGVIYCEDARLYEMSKDDKDIKRDFCFQIDTGKARYNIAAESLEDMKEWMTEIRVAKKKKLGVKVVSDERTLSPRNAASPR